MAMADAKTGPLPAEVTASLARLGLAAPGETLVAECLPGGVASDIWKVDLASGPACIKRALAKLKVAADWRAPVERNAYEYAWMEVAGSIIADAVPELLGADADAGLFVMRYLDPRTHPLWKDQLHAGLAETETATAVGERLGRIHRATAGDEAVAARFATDEIFYDIRLEPYLLATGRAHPDRAEALAALVDITASTKRALVQGDISPKNIVVGPRGPVFLDAECAWYGDPAFDLAFCLNHMLLKCLWTPAAAKGFLACFDALAAAYLAEVDWEDRAGLDRRTARLLPGLFLGRVDGKSPVEYLTDEADKDRVRTVARVLLAAPVETTAAVRAAWAEEVGA
jgi:aminoglycoside phosphotransferase (APT) family kinase protein